MKTITELADLARKAKGDGVATDTVSLRDYQYIWGQFKNALDEIDKARVDCCELKSRLAAAEADAERYRAMLRCMDKITVSCAGLTMTIHPAPLAHLLLNAFVQGAISVTDGDNARNPTKE